MAGYAVPNPEAVFYQQYEALRRDEVVGVLLALFLGGFGLHHFYLRRIGWGIFYLCLSWTGISWIIAWIECFFMPERVRRYNAAQAAALAAALGIGIPGPVGYPGWVAPGFAGAPYAAVQQPVTTMNTLAACASCGQANAAGARFCAGCGAKLS